MYGEALLLALCRFVGEPLELLPGPPERGELAKELPIEVTCRCFVLCSRGGVLKESSVIRIDCSAGKQLLEVLSKPVAQEQAGNL